jgi:hypothetical protein
MTKKVRIQLDFTDEELSRVIKEKPEKKPKFKVGQIVISDGYCYTIERVCNNRFGEKQLYVVHSGDLHFTVSEIDLELYQGGMRIPGVYSKIREEKPRIGDCLGVEFTKKDLKDMDEELRKAYGELGVKPLDKVSKELAEAEKVKFIQLGMKFREEVEKTSEHEDGVQKVEDQLITQGMVTVRQAETSVKIPESTVAIFPPTNVVFSDAKIPEPVTTWTFRLRFPNGEEIEVPEPPKDKWKFESEVIYTWPHKYFQDAIFSMRKGLNDNGCYMVDKQARCWWHDYYRRAWEENAQILWTKVWEKIPEKKPEPEKPVWEFL